MSDPPREDQNIIENIKTEYEAEISLIKQEHEKTLSDLRDVHEAEIHVMENKLENDAWDLLNQTEDIREEGRNDIAAVIDNYNQEIEELQNRNDEEQMHAAFFHQQNLILQNQNTALTNQVAELQNQLQNFTNQLQDLSNDNNALNIAVNTLKEHNDFLEREIKKFKN